jgi:hypothetical protein
VSRGLQLNLRTTGVNVHIHVHVCLYRQFKGTVSSDIVLHFRFWKIKLVLSAGPLVVLTFS